MSKTIGVDREEVGLIILDGQGDRTVALVPAHWIDWIENEEMPGSEGKSSWQCSLTPKDLQKKRAEEGLTYEIPLITIGSPHNDRALEAACTPLYEDWGRQGVSEVVDGVREEASKREYKITKEWYGYIY